VGLRTPRDEQDVVEGEREVLANAAWA